LHYEAKISEVLNVGSKEHIEFDKEFSLEWNNPLKSSVWQFQIESENISASYNMTPHRVYCLFQIISSWWRIQHRYFRRHSMMKFRLGTYEYIISPKISLSAMEEHPHVFGKKDNTIISSSHKIQVLLVRTIDV